jgi:hypothetical protein
MSLHSKRLVWPALKERTSLATRYSAMFKRYVSQQQLFDVCDDKIKINGVAEPFFFHIIYHKHHQHYAEMIAEGHIKDFGKPDE